MVNEKHKVHLKEEERKKLLAIISKGRNKAVVIQRAHILLKVDEGKADAGISQMLYVSEQTIRRMRLRFAEEVCRRPWKISRILPGVPNWVKRKKRPLLRWLAASHRQARHVGRWSC